MTPHEPTDRAPQWERLVSTALVGTARRTITTPPGLPERTESAAALLDLAALDTVRTRAGYTEHTATPIASDESDPRPEIGEAAAHRLDLVLDHRSELLPEWLGLVVRSGRRVPHSRLPDLLERAARDSVLRPAVAAATGTRATWLAGFNKAWAFVTAEPLPGDVFVDEDWEKGTFGRRRRALFALRAQNPAKARELLAKTWPHERKGEVRRGLLDALEPHLETEDAPLLDTALDDRNANVRGRALALITRLSDSAHAHRLRAHLREHLRVAPDAPRPIGVDYLDTTRADLLRDLALATPEQGVRPDIERWERTKVLVVHAPLDVWTDRFDTDPAGVLDLVEDHPELRDALVESVCLHQDAEWARAVLDHAELGLPHMFQASVHKLNRPRIRSLLATLPPAERCERMLAALEQVKKHRTLGHALMAAETPWTRELSEAVIGRFLDPLDLTVPVNVPDHRALAEAITAYMPPEHLDLLPEQPPYEEEAHTYLRLRDALRFRLDMHKELS